MDLQTIVYLNIFYANLNTSKKKPQLSKLGLRYKNLNVIIIYKPVLKIK